MFSGTGISREETLRWGDAGIHLVTSLATWGGLLTRLVKGFFLEACFTLCDLVKPCLALW
jgi:hypothetical protein